MIDVEGDSPNTSIFFLFCLKGFILIALLLASFSTNPRTGEPKAAGGPKSSSLPDRGPFSASALQTLYADKTARAADLGISQFPS